MAALHFTTVPCESYTAQKVQGEPHYCNISHSVKDIV